MKNKNNSNFIAAKVVLNKDTIEELKKKTNSDTTKDALAKAVIHYINCKHICDDPNGQKLLIIMKKRGRIIF